MLSQQQFGQKVDTPVETQAQPAEAPSDQGRLWGPARAPGWEPGVIGRWRMRHGAKPS